MSDLVPEVAPLSVSDDAADAAAEQFAENGGPSPDSVGDGRALVATWESV